MPSLDGALQRTLYSRKSWDRFLKAFDKIDSTVKQKFIGRYGLFREDLNEQTIQELVDYAYSLSAKYGEAAAALAAEMYDDAAIASGMALAPADPAAVATYHEVNSALRSALECSQNAEYLGATVSRLTKRAAADTTLQNARRDNAQLAWVSRGDTCAYCIALASRGWSWATNEKTVGTHAAHIHGNCDCMYAVRFDNRSTVAGYSPEQYKKMYDNAPLEEGQAPTSKNKINAMRRQFYKKNKDEINAQKRDAYEKRKEIESSKAEEADIT